MANRVFNDVQVHGAGFIGVPVKLTGTGASAPTVTFGPTVASVTRSAAGRLAILFTDPFIEIDAVDWTYQDTNHATTPTRKTVSIVRDNVTNVSGTIPAKTVEIVVEDIANAGTVTQSDLTTTQRVYLMFWMKNSAGKP